LSFYSPTTERPRYIKGTSTLLGLAVVMGLLILCNMAYLGFMNKKKAKAIREGLDDDHIGEGDLRLNFKYMI
jgi:hypothetical protein